MKKFRSRLSIVFIMLIGFSVLTSGVLMVQIVEDSHRDALQTSMARELRVIASAVDWPLDGSQADRIRLLTAEAQRYKQLSGERITFIDRDGTVLGDSDHEAATMDNHLAREEVMEAAVSGVGYSIRRSDTIEREMMYAALAVPPGSEAKTGYVRIAVSLEEIKATTNRIWTLLILGMFAYFLIAGLISYRIAGGLTKPLERAANVAKQIAKLNYKARVSVSGKDEFGQLAEAINAMADSLQLQMNKIREGESRLKSVLDNLISGVMLIDNRGMIVLLNRKAEEILGYPARELLGKKFDETHQQIEFSKLIRECLDTHEHIRDDLIFYYPEERVLEANLVPMSEGEEEAGIVIVLHDITAIRRLERMRTEFVANVSHELRTPITAVKGFAETLLAGAIEDKETARSFLQIINDESDRLSRLIEDTLALSKIESKRISLQYAPIRLAPFIDSTVEMVRQEADKRSIAIERRVDGDLYMEADEDRLRQILINLLSNAIHYTPEGGHVQLTVETFVASSGTEEVTADDEKVRITVQDTGIGIPRKDLPRIFERFYRVDKARSRSSGGTGLGLSIVKHLVELHRGTIRVESTVGVGSSFIIELPVLQ